MLMLKEREEIIKYGREMLRNGLTRGTGGNLSIYNHDLGYMAISPSSIPYEEMLVEEVVIMDLQGNIIDGEKTPSSEHEMHAIVYRERKEFSAMIHMHSTFAATLSCLRQPLVAVDYLVAFGGGKDVPCAEYATYGSLELAHNSIKAMEGRKAVLLANHGLNACGSTLKEAYAIAEEIEFCAELYIRAKAVGEPVILDEKEMDIMVKKFYGTGYGREA